MFHNKKKINNISSEWANDKKKRRKENLEKVYE